jgi:hypothetical protein
MRKISADLQGLQKAQHWASTHLVGQARISWINRQPKWILTASKMGKDDWEPSRSNPVKEFLPENCEQQYDAKNKLV